MVPWVGKVAGTLKVEVGTWGEGPVWNQFALAWIQVGGREGGSHKSLKMTLSLGILTGRRGLGN